MTEKILLKDLLFNKAKVEKIAEDIQQVHNPFNKRQFISDVIAKFPELELKARISWISQCLKNHLPSDYNSAVTVLIDALPKPNNPSLSDNDFGDFIYATYNDYVAKYGCKKEFLDISLNALYEITQRFSAEDSIRYFINAFPQETLEKLTIWSKDPHYHVRRLCSEGTRPKLPWCQKINLSVSEAIPILDTLFSDNTRFVTRSVANHLNDISKIDPELVVKTLENWQKSNKQNKKEMTYMINHALRTLIKQGNPQALKLLGISLTAPVTLINSHVPETVNMNTALVFSFEIEAQEDSEIIADYRMSFQNKSGKMTSKKVFKLKKFILDKSKKISLEKSHLMRENMTTRKLFRGEHELELLINGKSYFRQRFWLI